MRCEESLDITTLREAVAEYRRQAEMAERLAAELAAARTALAAAQAEAASMRPVFDALLRENRQMVRLLQNQREMLTAGVIQVAFPSAYGAQA